MTNYCYSCAINKKMTVEEKEDWVIEHAGGC